MIRARFYYRGGVPVGFCLRGHAGLGAEGQDILCAAVSSAAYLTVNTVTDFYNCPAEIREEEGMLVLSLDKRSGRRCAPLLEGFLAHLNQLSEQYPERIQLMKLRRCNPQAEDQHSAVRPQKGRRLHEKRP